MGLHVMTSLGAFVRLCYYYYWLGFDCQSLNLLKSP